MTKVIIASVIMASVTILKSVTYGKCDLWQMWLMASVTYGKCIMANVIMASVIMAKVLMKLNPIKLSK